MQQKQFQNNTKIIATLGPATSSVIRIKALLRAGVNVCRINASHGSHETHKIIIDNIRKADQELSAHTAILFDLQGPKLRIGKVEDKGRKLNEGDDLILTVKKVVSGSKEVFVQYPSICKDVKKNETILIDDGKIAVKVIKIVSNHSVHCKVIHGGLLLSNKGINLPDTSISLPALTEKDRNDLKFALSNKVEWIGLSFVRKPADLIELKSLIKKAKGFSRVIAKIEKPEALKNIDGILLECDAVMVARGDLGVEMPMEEVPLLQKMLVKKCLANSKPVIIATQMLESMIQNFRPTRAEVNDVGNSVLDGADALMLSAETSIGAYPVDAVKAMHKIIANIECDEQVYHRFTSPDEEKKSFISDTITYNAAIMARNSGAKAIITMTHSGYSAIRLTSQRPKANIFVFSDNPRLMKILNLVWGIRVFFYDKYESSEKTINDATDLLLKHKLVKKGDLFLSIGSTPLHKRGMANTIRLATIT
ncbi:MAG TPA: pyruvate kinase [Bacteroidia bacterium]|nr:pyruvate kinase [Bacteroidia bacterium]HNT79235.1 pyruvate kinase [Bacteroidia bacterium]